LTGCGRAASWSGPTGVSHDPGNRRTDTKNAATAESKLPSVTDIQTVQPLVSKVEPLLAKEPIISSSPAPATAATDSDYQSIQPVAPKVIATAPIIVVQADTTVTAPETVTTPDAATGPDTAPVPSKSKNTKTRAS